MKISEFPDHPGNVHFANLLPTLKNYLAQGKMRPKPPEILLDAFKLFDPCNRGFIRRSEMIEIMKSFGEELSSDELNEMLKTAVDSSSENGDCIFYEDYINRIHHEPFDSVYKLMTLEVEQRQKNSTRKFRETKKKLAK